MNWRGVVEPLVAFVLAVVGLGYRLGAGVHVFDEGLILVGSLRVLGGEMPYRDFWTLYGPGAFYLNALAFGLWGPSVMVARVLSLVLEAAVAAETLVLGRALGGRVAGWLAFVLAVAFTTAIQPHSGYPAVPALAAALGAVIAVGVHESAIAGGVLIGVTALFRHDFAAYSGMVLAVRYAALGAGSGASPRRDLVRLLAGLSAVVVPVYGLLVIAVGLDPLVHQLVVFPATVLPQYAHLPVLDRAWSSGDPADTVLLLAGLMLLAAIVVMLWIVLAVLRDRALASRPRVLLALALGLLALALANHARFRFDPIHTWPLVLAALPLVAAAPLGPIPRVARFASAIGAIGLLAIGVRLAADYVEARSVTPQVPLRSARTDGIMIPATFAYYNDVLRAVTSMTRPGEPIYSGSVRHDRILVNDVLIYFLVDRPVPIAYHELTRGLITTEPIQAEVAAALDAHGVRVVVLLRLESGEPNRSSIPSGVTVLDRHLRAHFVRHATIGLYEIWVRD
jgi:hypothetical protein